MDFFTALDQSALFALNGFVGLSPAFDRGLGLLTDWRFFRCAPLAGFVLWAWFRDADPTARSRLIAGLTGVTLAVLVAVFIQALAPVHARPFVMARDLGLRIPDRLATNWGHGNSFPSDTVTLHFALAALIWSVSRRWGIVAMVWVTVLVAVPRAYLLYHWPSDILAGALIGVGGVYILINSAWSVNFARRMLDWGLCYPQFFYPALFFVLYQFVDAFDAADVVLYQLRHGRLLATG